MRPVLRAASAALLIDSGARGKEITMDAGSAARNIVLVHGGFVDGSGWQGVYAILKRKGYNVSIVQNPTTSLADDGSSNKQNGRGAGWPSYSRWSFLWRGRHH